MFQNQLAQRLFFFPTLARYVHTTDIVQKARPGTRAKREAIKKAMKLKKVEVKKEFIPYKMKLEMEKVGKVSPRLTLRENLKPAVDNVYFTENFIWNRYTVAEAAEMHRETHHPTQFNKPNETLIAFIELSMRANKKNNYIEPFRNVVSMPAYFPTTHKRTILAVCKDEKSMEEAKEAGATLAVGPEFFRMAKAGEIDFKDYDHVVCHTSLLPEFVSYRTLIKKKMPNVGNGTAGQNIVSLVEKFIKGVQYNVVKDKYDHDYASIEIPIGTLEMSNEELEKNVEAFLVDIEKTKSNARSANVITKVHITCFPTTEKLIIDHEKFFAKEDEDTDTEDTQMVQKAG